MTSHSALFPRLLVAACLVFASLPALAQSVAITYDDGPSLAPTPRMTPTERGYEKWFRFTYLREGNTLEKRDGMRAFLRQHGSATPMSHSIRATGG